MPGIVIDECVVIEAVRHKKPDGSPALAETEFMCKLLRSPHKIFVNKTIIDKFHDIEKKINATGRSGNYNNMICKNFLAALLDGGKTNYIDGIKVDRKGLKKCDKAFVGVALQSGSVFVTSDAPLRAIVDEMRSEGAKIECLDAEQAICHLDPPGKAE